MAVVDRLTIELDIDNTRAVAAVRRNGQVVGQLQQQFTGLAGNLNALTAAQSAFQRNAQNLYNTMNRQAQGARSLTRSNNSLITSFRNMAAVGFLAAHAMGVIKDAVIEIPRSIIAANAEIERMTQMLRGMSNSRTGAGMDADATKDIKDMLQLSKEAPFAFEEMTRSLVKFKAVNLDDATRRVKNLADAVASFGGTDEIFHRAAVAIQQMAGKGVISMEELRQQLGEAVPNAIKLMARAAGLSYGELVEKVSKGVVEANQALALMMDEMERSMGGSGVRMMSTYVGMTQQLKTAWMEFQLQIGKTGFFDEVKKQLGDLLGVFDTVQMKSYANDIGRALKELVVIVRELIDGYFKYEEAIKLVLAAWGMSKVWAVVRGLQATTAAAIGTKSAIMALGSTTLMSMFGPLATQSRSAAYGMGLVMGAIRGLSSPLGLLIGSLTAASMAFNVFADSAEDAFEKVVDGTGAVTRAEIALADAQAKRMSRNIASLQEQKKKLEEDLRRRQTTRGDLGVAGQWLVNAQDNSIRRDIQDIDRQLQEAGTKLDEFHRARTAQMSAIADTEVSAYTTKILRQVAVDENLLHSQYEIDLRDLETAKANELKVIEKSGEDREAINKKYHDLQLQRIKQLNEATVAGFEGQIQEQQDLLANAVANNASQDVINTHKGALGELYKKQREAKEVGERMLEVFNRGLVEIDKSAGKDKESPLDRKIQSLRQNLASLTEQLQDGTPELEKFNAALSGKKLGADATKKPELVAEGRELAKRIDLVKAQIDWNAKWKSTNDRAVDSISNMDEELARLNFTMETGYSQMFQNAAVVEKFMHDFEGLATATGMSDEKMRKLLATIEELRKKAAQVDYTELSSKYDEKTRVIQQALMTEEQAITARYELERSRAEALHGKLTSMGEEAKVAADSVLNYIAALEEQYVRDMESPIQRLVREWGDATKRMKEAAADWLTEASDQLTEFVMTGKMNFADFAESIIRDIIKIRIQAAISAMLNQGGGVRFINSLIDGISGLFSGGSAAGSSPSLMTAGSEYVISPFAFGGIMTTQGPMRLNRYSMGGIANTPQVAMFGEGDNPEAYVPLPDGRSIPVTMRGGATEVTNNVEVNVINQSGQQVEASERGRRFDGKKMVLDIVLEAASRPGNFRDSIRQAVR